MSDVRMVSVQPGDRIVVLNNVNLLKFTGWVEAHRPPGEWEPGFLGRALAALEAARDGEPLGEIVTCGGCGLEHAISMYYDPDVGGWFCRDDGDCDRRRMGEEARS
jgi:hypothetical protein